MVRDKIQIINVDFNSKLSSPGMVLTGNRVIVVCFFYRYGLPAELMYACRHLLGLLPGGHMSRPIDENKL